MLSSGAVVVIVAHLIKFHSQYGSIYEWQAFGVVRVRINSDAIANDLLVQQGKLYNDEPDLPAALGMKAHYFLPLMGDVKFPTHRISIMGMMRASRLQGFYDHPAKETGHTLRKLLEQPSEHWLHNLIAHCARSAALCAWGSPKAADTLIEVNPPPLKTLSPGGPLPNQMTFLDRLPFLMSPWKQAEAKRSEELLPMLPFRKLGPTP
ncbi:hypothetical protein BAUCODRAFT_150576 [Baudoinia panamericana UAMH 10762]|uniref:Uncharacterized protein n=1 Tax=Baudoinia panamericana (strain UAMH 10762) TaxID=717646 RepID=M2MP18_BAUPA|nr:uncharacterized protein BAUCODRAFT_150576 [Baudoinia panamericana UAMH 10762]EMC93218.1 hypothetical protein BAUCODRAFT_150576 [Baudoinia panamericana UAMH 10762]